MFCKTRVIFQLEGYSKSFHNIRLLSGKKLKPYVRTHSILEKSTILKIFHNKVDDFLDKSKVLIGRTKYSQSILNKLTAASVVVNLQNENLKNLNNSNSIPDQTVTLLEDKINKDETGTTTNSPEIIRDTADSSISNTNFINDPIPEPPPIPDIPDLTEQINALGESTFASLGLGGWTPVGLIQNCFEYVHVTLGIPWWEVIVLGTLVIRICMFPLVIIAQRNGAKMNNNLPQLQAIQLKLTEARNCGDQLEAAKLSQEMMLFMKEKELNPLKNMLVPLAQMPVFISFFIGLRQMANVPVESLKYGGLWWFTDLTLPDQFMIMPIVTSITLWATIELGTDSAKLSSQNMQTMKYVLRAIPICILPFTVNFPGAILVYWTASNFISLAQVGILKIPKIREYCNIEKQVFIDPKTLPVKPKGFTEGIKESWTNMKVVRQLEERRRLDEIQFRRAGKGPVVKTYKYDPTKEVDSSRAISAKKR